MIISRDVLGKSDELDGPAAQDLSDSCIRASTNGNLRRSNTENNNFLKESQSKKIN